MARREAHARSLSPSPWSQPEAAPEPLAAVARAEASLAERAQAFAEASEALRAEIAAFAEVLAAAEAHTATPTPAPVERKLTLVEPLPAAGDEPGEDEHGAEDTPPTPEEIAQFFRKFEQREPGPAAPEEPAAETEPQPTPRNPVREQLYADIAGAIIGIAGAAALINFVFLN